MPVDRAASLQLILEADQNGYPALTIELSRRYLAIWPDDRHALGFYADALASVARYSEATAAYEQAITLAETEEQRSRLYSARGHLARARAQIDEAEAWYRRAIASRPLD